MAPEPTKYDPTLSDGDKQKNLEQELKEMISSLTKRLSSIQRQKAGGSAHHKVENEGEDGISIITLAGSNIGATMRGEVDEKTESEGLSPIEQEDFTTYVNSNFQAINNSLMLEGSYTTNDPGVHLDITDNAENRAWAKHANKGKKQIRGSYKSDQQTEHSD